MACDVSEVWVEVFGPQTWPIMALESRAVTLTFFKLQLRSICHDIHGSKLVGIQCPDVWGLSWHQAKYGRQNPEPDYFWCAVFICH